MAHGRSSHQARGLEFMSAAHGGPQQRIGA